jgi:hypothetical protein
MNRIFRTPLFWIFFTLVTVGCAYAFVKLTPIAFPQLHLNVTMDKAQALSQARTIAREQKLGPEKFEHSASFEGDSYVNTFIELEGGGKEALAQIIAEGIYEPYTWVVRHFEPLNIHELFVIFTPQGRPYGFIENISEDSAKTSLSLEEAQILARNQAQLWNIKLEHYELVETSKQENLFKRIDYTFVYEKKDIRVGEAPLRVRMVVKGDRLRELVHFLKIPDEFGRRYEEMRSRNDALAWGAGIAVVVLYILVLGLLGFIFLFKQSYLLWRGPIIVAGIIALLNLASKLNNIPQIWMSYNTALDPHAFLGNFLILSAYQFLFFWVFFSFIFIVAEGLTRKAFPEHLQLRTIWRPNNAASLKVWGQTLSGYFLVFACLAFQAAFYILTSRYLGWWIPAEGLFDPNILGSFLPWLEPISKALSAGAVEECVFRALPLASAALLGKRFGHKKCFLISVFIMQALIFGAAHANYPMQPAYARIAELFVIAMIFGGVYLSLGLLPAIITHTIFDIILMSMPLFISSSTALIISKIIIIIIALVPIFIILYARMRTHAFTTPQPQAYNKTFRPQPHTSGAKTPNIITLITPIQPKFRTIIYILAIGSLASCIFLGNFHADAPALSLKRSEAIARAQDFLSQHELSGIQDYKILSAVLTSDNTQQDFIWQVGGAELFKKLLGTYITPQYWLIRFARFSGPVEERAQEYQIYINQEGHVFRFIHQLPEAQPGLKLNEEEARKIVLEALKREIPEPEKLKEISALKSTKPARNDWVFVYADPAYALEQARAEIAIKIAGAKVVGFERQIHVPEKWLREEQSNDQRTMIITLLCTIPLYLILLVGLILAFRNLIFTSRAKKLATLIFIPLALIFVASIFNNTPEIMASLSTTKPWGEQLLMELTGGVLINIAKAFGLAVLFSFILMHRSSQAVPKNFAHASTAMSLGIFLASLQIILSAIFPSKAPHLALINGLGSYVPLLSSLSSALFQYGGFLAFFSLVAIVAQKELYARKRILALGILFLSGFLLSGIFLSDQIQIFLTLGSMLGLFFVAAWFMIFRYDHALVPLAFASYYIIIIMQHAIMASSWLALINAIVASIIILFLSLWLFLNINKPDLTN